MVDSVSIIILYEGNILSSSYETAYIGIHSAISECHSHPLSFCVEFTHIQHQVSLSSITSPSANRQPAIHKWGTSGEVDLDWSVVFRCTPAHPLPTHGNLCTQCSSYKPEGIHECSTFNFIFISSRRHRRWAKGAMDSTSVFFLPLLLPITLWENKLG